MTERHIIDVNKINYRQHRLYTMRVLEGLEG